jgi:hypothetical protein
MPKSQTTSTLPPWYRIISAAGVTTLLVAIGFSFGFWHWLEALDLPGLTERAYEFFNAPNGITWGHTATFAASLVLVSVPRLFCTRERRLKTLTRLRRLTDGLRSALHAHNKFAHEHPEEYLRSTRQQR